MQYLSEEEFDLEYIVTGHRSSTVMEGEVADAEDVISKEEESKVKDAELSRFTGEQLKKEKKEVEDEISFKPSKKVTSAPKIGFNSDNIIERISAGNYKGVTPKDICQYFKHLFEISYPGERYVTDFIKEPSIIKSKLAVYEIEVFISMIEFFIQRYDKLFFNSEFPRPRIYQLSIPWILNKLGEQFARAEKAKEELERPIHVQNSSQAEARMF
jgi:hypothetical protein